MKKFFKTIKTFFLRFFPCDSEDRLLFNILKVLLFVLVIMTVCALAYLCYATANAITGNVTKFYDDMFRDFSQIGYYAVKRNAFSMENGSSYSAFFLLMMWPFAAIFKKDLDAMGVVQEFGEAENLIIISSYRFWIAFFLFYAVCFVLLYLVTRAFIKKHSLNVKGVFIVFLISGPALAMLIRGNLLLPSLILTMVFLCWYDSKNKVAAEFALIALAVAGVLKIYPLVFGVFLLKDKKWFEIIRTALYFALFYILPCFCFDGGFKVYLENLFGFSVVDNKFTSIKNMSFAGIVYKLIFLPLTALGVPEYAAFDWVCMALALALLAFIVVAALVTRSYFKRCLLCVCALVLVPNVSYPYALIFTWIVFLTYFKDFSAHKTRTNFVFLILSCVTYLLPVCWYAQIIISVILIVLTFIAGVTAFKEKKLEVYT
ncbi:MAG: DUF2029 domain-containing protein [Clostridia bacterium]|nr:DUF2029 domain-containing protein [Clostridia bacterium]